MEGLPLKAPVFKTGASAPWPPPSTPSRRGGRPTAQPESLVQRWANAVGGRAADVLYPLFLWHDPSIVCFGMNICHADIPVLSPVGIVGFLCRSIQLPAVRALALGHPRALVFRGQKKKPWRAILQGFFILRIDGCGGRTRTGDLWVMSPTSCRCSTPRRL